LQNGHPTACGYLYRTNDHDIASLDPALSNPPLSGSPVETSRVRLINLEKRKRALAGRVFHRVGSGGTDLDKGIYRSPDVVCKLRDGDWQVAPRFVLYLNLALERLVPHPLHGGNAFLFSNEFRERLST
jgi:hypothetical protein